MSRRNKNNTDNNADIEISEAENKEPAQELNDKEPEKAEKKKKSGKNPFKSKKFRHGSLSVVFTVMFVAAIVLINVIINLVLDRFDISADLTEGSIFTLSEESEAYIRSVNDSVTFYVTADRDTMKSSGEPLYEQIVEFLDKMADLNGGFEVKYVNLLTDPDFSNGYKEDLQNYEIIVQSGKTNRYRILEMSGFLRVTLSDGKTYPYSQQVAMYINYGIYTVTRYSSIAEQELLSAIMSVSKEEQTVVTFLTGYGESDSSALEAILTANAYDVRTAEIEKTEAIDPETDIAVIYGPTKDYSLESVTKIDEWLSNGGKYGRDLVYVSTVESSPLPNISEYLSEWGLSVENGYVLQFDTDHVFYSNSMLPLMQDLDIKTDTDYYENLKAASGSVLIGYPVRPVTKLWEEQSNMANKTLVSAYGDKCILYPFDAAEDWQPKESDFSSYDVIVEASKVQYEGTEPHYSRLIAVGSDQLFVDYFTQASNYSNGELALTLFDTNSDSAGDTISVVEKSFTAETYQLDQSTQIGIGLTFAVIIPAVIIIVGIIVWAKRRRL